MFTTNSILVGSSRTIIVPQYHKICALSWRELTRLCASWLSSLSRVLTTKIVRTECHESFLGWCGVIRHVAAPKSWQKITKVLKIGFSSVVSSPYVYLRDKQQHVKNIVGVQGKTIVFCRDGTMMPLLLSRQISEHKWRDGYYTKRRRRSLAISIGYLDPHGPFQGIFHCIVTDFVWTFVYDIFAILLAVGAFVHARILLSGLGLGKRGHVAGGFCCTLAEVGKCWLIATCRTWQCPM